MTNETVASQGQDHEQANAPSSGQTADVFTETTNWGDDPMLKYLANVKDSLVAGKELRAKVARLEATVKTMQTTINELVAERVELKTAARVSADEARAAVTEAEQLRASLDYEKELFVTLNREHDQLQAAHKMLIEDYEKAKDERDVAVLDREDFQRQAIAQTDRLEAVTQELSAARAQWFKQEDDMQRTIRDLGAERASFEEKFRKCKSMAGQIMALDQVRPEPVEGPQYN
jgi:chromosome segregation ATPase